MKSYKVYSLDDLRKPIEELLKKKPFLVFLEGPLGAGKTTFVNEIMKWLEKENFSSLNVMSPTFSLINEYKGVTGTYSHIDLYRVSEKDFDVEEVFEAIEASDIAFIEWGSKIPQVRQAYILEEGVLHIEIRVKEHSAREFVFSYAAV